MTAPPVFCSEHTDCTSPLEDDPHRRSDHAGSQRERQPFTLRSIKNQPSKVGGLNKPTRRLSPVPNQADETVPRADAASMGGQILACRSPEHSLVHWINRVPGPEATDRGVVTGSRS